MGYVCAQVNPSRAGDREAMMAMARRFHAWAPNIAVKLPAVAAGLDVLEDCVAEGITTTATVSFTVPAGARHRRAVPRRHASAPSQNGHRAGQVFRRDHDRPPGRLPARSGARQSGRRQRSRHPPVRPGRHQARLPDLQERGYEAVLLVAALRGAYHLTELAGADLVMSIAPGAAGVVRRPRTIRAKSASTSEVPADVIDTALARCLSSSRPTNPTA